jgi:hypothetical protein
MSVTINIRHSFPEVAARLDSLAKSVGDKAVVRALNTTVGQGLTAMARAISKEYRVTVAQAKERLDIRRAITKGGGLRLEAALLATRRGKGRGMNLIHFVTRIPQRTKRGKLAQLKLQIKRAGGAKTINGAFVATNRKTGGRAVFIREGRARMPIKTLTTIDIPQMFNTKRINGAIRTVMLERFDINFKRELRSVLKGYAK